MGRITASVGLMSGVDIQTIVTKLLTIEAKPRDALTSKNTALTNQQTAVTTLSAYLLSVQYITKNLSKASVFDSLTAATSDPNSLAATITGSPAAGTYQYTPVQTAQNQQFLGTGFKSATDALGGGSFSFRYGSRVDQGAKLSDINGGQGFTRGTIRITDRSGASAQVDLSYAQNIDDVLAAINNSSSINVSATAVDGHIQLTDNTGLATSGLKVQEVGNGTTAASLGLAGIDVAGTTASGQTVLKLSNNLLLSALNDGMGVNTNTALPDISYTLHDGTTGTIDLSPIIQGGSTVKKESTLGDIVKEVSDQTNGKLQVTVSSDGQRLVITDSTATDNPTGTLSISNAAGSTAASDLGLVVSSTSSAAATGSRILGGLKTALLSSLKGGQGVGSLGYLKVTDRNGHSANLNLSGSETLQDAVGKINSQIQTANAQPGALAVSVTAQVNQAGNGIQLVDTSGAATGTLTAANSNAANDGGNDGTSTAVALGFATVSAPGSSSNGLLNSGDLHLRAISRNTLLGSVNGGTGVPTGNFTITDSAGNATRINLTSSMQTVGDVVDAINRNTTGIHADFNANGDGILLQDTAHGSGTLSVTEGNSTTAHDLNLLATAKTVSGSQVIDGTTTQTVTLAATDTLTTLQNKINALGGGLSAGILTDGSSAPYRLSLAGSHTGTAGRIVVDSSQIAGLSLQQLSAGQDALLALAGGSSAGSILVSSSSNTFNGVLPGVSLTMKNASTQPVIVTIASDDSQVAGNLQALVTNYNKFRAELTKDTAYDAATNTGSVLSSDSTALQLDTQFSELLTSSFGGTGSLQSLADVGITVQNDGTLSFDQSVLNSAWANNSAAVKQLFTTKDSGISDQFSKMIDQLAGNTDSILSSRITMIQDQISDNQSRIDLMTERLTFEQDRLYTSFYNMDLTIGKLKNSLSVINSLSGLTPYTGVTTSG